MKQRNHHPLRQDRPQTITRAVTHIRLGEANASKLTALDDLASNEYCEAIRGCRPTRLHRQESSQSLAHEETCSMAQSQRLAVVQPPA